jgi:hypothetical protein
MSALASVQPAAARRASLQERTGERRDLAGLRCCGGDGVRPDMTPYSRTDVPTS